MEQKEEKRREDLFVLTGHDVRDTEVGEDDGADVEQTV